MPRYDVACQRILRGIGDRDKIRTIIVNTLGAKAPVPAFNVPAPWQWQNNNGGGCCNGYN